MQRIVIKKGREKSLLMRHQWLFSGSIAEVILTENSENLVEQEPELWEVVDHEGNFLAYGSYNPNSKIAVRVWSFDIEDRVFSYEFFDERISKAVNLRLTMGFELKKHAGVRLINSEGDFLPGVMADFYDNFIVVQFLTQSANSFKNIISDILLEKTGALGVYERSDVEVRKLENLDESVGLLAGVMPPSKLMISENGAKFQIDIKHGHKSGFYLDQARSREVVGRFAKRKNVLNCFSYTGGFGVVAAKNGAKTVVNVDSSQAVLDIAKVNMDLNEIPEDKYENICADVFSLLRKFRAEQRTFDVIILDPPKLANSQKALARATKAYKDMALVAFQILNEGGILVNFSCSGLLDRALFQKITFDAAKDAEVNAQLLCHLEQNCDHVVALAVPEGFYLKGHVISI